MTFFLFSFSFFLSPFYCVKLKVVEKPISTILITITIPYHHLLPF
uniref:Uncharacterized protein n=1 Tax=Rhizophora mucronata TaxID=61149 RepID=A0A2P2ITZ3_RHIMU